MNDMKQKEFIVTVSIDDREPLVMDLSYHEDFLQFKYALSLAVKDRKKRAATDELCANDKRIRESLAALHIDQRDANLRVAELLEQMHRYIN